MKHFIILIALLTFPTAQTRDWTSLDGKVIQADLVSATDTAVVISRAGSEFTVPLDRLVEADQTYVKHWLEEKAAETGMPNALPASAT
jgi:hypothetical protein